MAIVLPITPEYDPDLYDRVTNKSCTTEKVVDITEDCPGANDRERAVLLFTRDSNSRIVQIARPYEGHAYTGAKIHFSVDGLEHEMHVASPDDTFGSQAQRLGLSKHKLRALIETHAPV